MSVTPSFLECRIDQRPVSSAPVRRIGYSLATVTRTGHLDGHQADQVTMCNRYNLHSRLNTLVQEMHAELEEEGLLDLPPRYNIAPTQLVPAIRTNLEGRRMLTRFRWGLVPSWAKDLKI